MCVKTDEGILLAIQCMTESMQSHFFVIVDKNELHIFIPPENPQNEATFTAAITLTRNELMWLWQLKINCKHGVTGLPLAAVMPSSSV